MRKFLAVLVALVVGVAAAVALADTAPTTGTNTSCATATTPAHTVGVDGTDVHTIPGDTATQCHVETYTIPTVTETVTATTGTTTTTPTPVPPTNTTAPSISGTPQSGQTLTADPGSWTGDTPITFAYQWSDGSTGKTDLLTDADVGTTIFVTVTASNDATPPTVSASSSSVGPVTAAPSNGFTVPCALTFAAGADPNTSCWATHTGVLNGTGVTEAQIKAGAAGFTKTNGELVISAPNTTIDHRWVNGCITIQDGANNTVIKNTLVTQTCNGSGDNAGGSAINTGQGPNIAKNTLIQDVTIDGGLPAFGAHTAGITLDGGKAIRVNLFGFAQGFISDTNTAAAPALFQDDYGHDYRGCSHDDGTWFNSSSYVTFQHGWVMTNDATQQGGAGCSTAALAGGSDYGPQDHITYDSNYANGVTGENIHTGCGSTQMTITNNASDNGAAKLSSDGGYQSLSGNAWSGNYLVDHTTGAKLGSWGPFSTGC